MAVREIDENMAINYHNNLIDEEKKEDEPVKPKVSLTNDEFNMVLRMGQYIKEQTAGII